MISFRPMHKSVGRFLAKERKRSGLSQKQVAQLSGGFHTQFISNVERGVCGPPTALLRKLIRIYEVDHKKLKKFMLTILEEQIERQLLS